MTPSGAARSRRGVWDPISSVGSAGGAVRARGPRTLSFANRYPRRVAAFAGSTLRAIAPVVGGATPIGVARVPQGVHLAATSPRTARPPIVPMREDSCSLFVAGPFSPPLIDGRPHATRWFLGWTGYLSLANTWIGWPKPGLADHPSLRWMIAGAGRGFYRLWVLTQGPVSSLRPSPRVGQSMGWPLVQT